MDDETRTKLLRRLKRAEGQVGAVRRMVEEGTECGDVLMQIAAARGALGKVGQTLLHCHLETCVRGAMSSGDEDAAQAQIDSLVAIFGRFGGMGAS